MSAGFDRLKNAMVHGIQEWNAERYTERHGHVTSYDPQNYRAKVKFMPEGNESGWLPVETGHVGNGYGIAIGLQPGQGQSQDANGSGGGGQGSQSNSQFDGDQVIVRYHEGDYEAGKIVQRVHSNKQKPPMAESGEMIFWTKFNQNGQGSNNSGGGSGGGGGGSGGGSSGGQGGQQQGSQGQQIKFAKDGSLTLTDGNGATIKLDGQGNITIDCKKLTITNSDTTYQIGKIKIGLDSENDKVAKIETESGVAKQAWSKPGG